MQPYMEEAMEVCRQQTEIYLRTHHLPPSVLSEDLLQEARLRMLKHLYRYDPAMGELRAFLRPHVVGAIKDYLKKTDGYRRYGRKTVLISLTPTENGSTKRCVIDAVDYGGNIEAAYIRAVDLSRALKIVMGSIPPRHQKILRLYYWEGKTMREIGELVGISEPGVCMIHRKSIDRLSKILHRGKLPV